MKELMNFLTSLANHSMNNFQSAMPDEIKFRMKTCMECEHSEPTNFTCTQCGCFLTMKTQWASESCPIGLWQATKSSEANESIQQNQGCDGCG